VLVCYCYSPFQLVRATLSLSHSLNSFNAPTRRAGPDSAGVRRIVARDGHAVH